MEQNWSKRLCFSWKQDISNTRIPGTSPLLGFGSSSALHRALQGTKLPHTGPWLMAGFGWGRCMHLSPRTSRICYLQDLAFLTPCSCEAPAWHHHILLSHTSASARSGCSEAVLPVIKQISSAPEPESCSLQPLKLSWDCPIIKHKQNF